MAEWLMAAVLKTAKRKLRGFESLSPRQPSFMPRSFIFANESPLWRWLLNNVIARGQRGLATKRSLALREFALGAEGLERFVRNEPLRRVHECAFGVLAMESELVD